MLDSCTQLHLSQPGEFFIKPGYRTLKSLGPNDGRALLADQIYPGMPIVPEFGEDHYLRDSRSRANILALVYAVLTYEETTWAHRKGVSPGPASALLSAE